MRIRFLGRSKRRLNTTEGPKILTYGDELEVPDEIAKGMVEGAFFEEVTESSRKRPGKRSSADAPAGEE